MLRAGFPCHRSPPPLSEPDPFQPPTVDCGRTGAGLRLVLAPRSAVPLVNLQLVFRAGAQYDPPDREGLASLLAPLLREGTVLRSGHGIADQAESRGADLFTGVDWEIAFLTIDLLEEDLELGLELLWEVASQPRLAAADFERQKRNRLAKILHRRFQGSCLAEDWFACAVYGEGRYGRTLLGSEASLGRLQPADLAAFYDRGFAGSEARLIVVGRFSPSVLLRCAESLAPSLPSLAPPPVAPTLEPCGAAGGQTLVVDLAAARQTETWIGQPSLPRSHPDFPALQLLNLILGGTFSSRLSVELRERRGLTYQVRSTILSRSGPSPFVVSAALETDSVANVLGLIEAEIDRLRQDLVTSEELEAAKSYLSGSLLRVLASSYELAKYLRKLDGEEPPADSSRRFLEHVRGIDRHELREVACRCFKPRLLTTILVGPADRLRLQLSGPREPIVLDPRQDPTTAGWTPVEAIQR